jgi:hypothetical protein
MASAIPQFIEYLKRTLRAGFHPLMKFSRRKQFYADRLIWKERA